MSWGVHDFVSMGWRWRSRAFEAVAGELFANEVVQVDEVLRARPAAGVTAGGDSKGGDGR